MDTGDYFAVLARRCHERMPIRIRQYLNHRGILDTVIDRHLLGWNGSRITIPIPDRQGQAAFFKLAKDPEDRSESPKMLATPGARAELYGWKRVLSNPSRIIVCEGEFDRLVLEARGFAAVTSTAGAATFLPEWAKALRVIPSVYICFDNDVAGEDGAVRLAALIPHVRVVRLPREVGDGGDVTDFFVRLGRTTADFEALLAEARPLPAPTQASPALGEEARLPARDRSEYDRIKSRVPIQEIIARYVPLRVSGERQIGQCPFHADRTPSFVVYPQTQSFYCFGCRVHGDVISFLMRVEHLTFTEALKVLRRLLDSHA